MKSVCGTVCLAVAVAIAVVLCWQVANQPEYAMLFAGEQSQQADVPAAPVAPAATAPRERIMHLPNDGQAWHLSVCLSDNWQGVAREKQIRDWFFDANVQLTSLRVQTQFHEYTPRHAMFRSLLAHRIPAMPAIVLQDATGYVVYASCESNAHKSIPEDPNALADDIAEAIAARCQQVGMPTAECERCKPQPKPTPTPNINVDVNVTKPIVPQIGVPVAKKDEFPWGLLGGVCAIVILASIAYNFRREMSAQ